ncbi:MAG TPA: hypothetical protein VF794_31840 [Archangium sp.]|jgi:hypothetical protein|uniref:hypothetical protein n=1 Tax=Archangium sp. TaxID=1872627 RepID=UPI002EDA283B
MSEPAPLPTSSDGLPLPAPSEASGVPCERCGTFIQGEPQQIGVRQVCESCAPLLRKELRLYPTWYVYVLGIVLNFTLAGILSAINWKRLGDKTRMRNSLIITAFGVAWSTLVVVFEFKAGGGIITNIIGTRVAAQALAGVYDEHKKAGGARANLLWPLVSLVGAFALLVVVAVVYLGLTGQRLAE